MKSTIVKINEKIKPLGVIGACFLLTLVLLLGAIALQFNKKTIYPRIYIETVDVGHLTKGEAREEIESIFEQELKTHGVSLIYEDYQGNFSYKELGCTYLYEDAVERAYAIGRRGNWLERLRVIYSLQKKPIIITLQTEFDWEKYEQVLVEIKEQVHREPIDAKITRKSGSFVRTPEVVGIAVADERLRQGIKESIPSFGNQVIEIPVDYIYPRITLEKLQHIDGVIGEYKTTFSPQEEGRNTNIMIASNSINGVLLMPGDEFSFNEQTGPRGVSEGYQEAPVIVNGKLVPGIGGGICQVSSTLYNAIVRADLEITARQNHSLPVGYVPLGHDATVVYGHIDFKFINNQSYPIYIESASQGNQVYVRVYGKKTDEVLISLVSDVTETIVPNTEVKKDPNMYIGEKRVEVQAKNGYRVNTYKIYARNGVEFKRELISKDYYRPVHGVVVEGTKPRPIVEQVEEKKEALQMDQGQEEVNRAFE